MKQVELPSLCRHVTDLVRGQIVRLQPAEFRTLRPFVEMGLLQLRRRPTERSETCCQCVNPRLFEFHFYYRWLPRNAHLLRPQATQSS